ncbi:MAG: S-layer homology domain-containing protein [Agathobaculum sp.]|uniref:InlB B-repeat-containing protein n=1 Tax=Agathobaculum sp. TaxID=2048138 RepID=UPI002A81DBE1|nr:S-layer homology domain-containing protein [Agathobaculum sp.]MDY3712078.1 S-layer homology domain-containing protein [Agathobaculum sp.]
MRVNTPASTAHGTVTVSPKNAVRGTTVTITAKPDAGYELHSLTVTGKDGSEIKLTGQGGGVFTFIMPSSEVSIKAIFAEAGTVPVNPFTDVNMGAYYYDAVLWAVENGITSGTSATAFSPDASCTRAQAVTFLWRAAGSPVP